MDIKKHTAWFHDGDLKEIVHDVDSNTALMTMSSAQIIGFENEFDAQIELSKYKTIMGILHIEGIKKIYANDKEFKGPLKKLYSSAEVIDFEVFDQRFLELGISWNAPKKWGIDYTMFKIEAEKIWWENIPDLYPLWG